MADGAADPWGQNLESFFHGARERRIGAEQERQRPEAEYADKLLAAHAQGAEQGAAAEREAIRSEMVEEADECERQGFTAAAWSLREFAGRLERDQHQQVSLPLTEARP